MLQLRGETSRSLATMQRVIEINRNYAPAWASISIDLATLGRPDEAVHAGTEALRLSPRDPRLYAFRLTVAKAHFYAGRDGEALAWARAAIEARPTFGIAQAWVAAAAANSATWKPPVPRWRNSNV